MTASVGSSMAGSGTLSTRTSLLPWNVRAFISNYLLASFAARAGLGHQSVCFRLRPVRHEPAAVGHQPVRKRSGDDTLFALHQGIETLPRDLRRVVLVGRADSGVLHVRPLEELRLRGPRHEGGDRHTGVLQLTP